LWTDVDEADVVYAFGLDLLFLAWLATLGKRNGPRLVYDVADLPQKAMEETMQGWAVRIIEGFLLSKVTCLVVTSEAYLDEYFYQHYDLSTVECIVIENKLDLHTTPPVRSEREVDQIDKEGWRIGYFGLLRCRQSWKTLKGLVKLADGRFELYLRGIPMQIDSLPNEAREIPNVKYGGPYQSPGELADIYTAIDLSWVAYQHSSDAELVRSNRFYEACFFQTPMIGQEGTLDGSLIKKHNIGFQVDITQPKRAIDRILRITKQEWRQWKHNLRKLPASVYTYTDEHRRLVEALRESSNSTHNADQVSRAIEHTP
jgi:succinoglycan biosynthesis protein ExoL